MFGYDFGIYIKMLAIDNNLLTCIPKNLNKLSYLYKLDVSHNFVNNLMTNDYYNMTNIKELNLSYNNISTLKDDLILLTKLEYLRLNNNLIYSIKLSIFCPLIKEIQLNNNLISCINGLNYNIISKLCCSNNSYYNLNKLSKHCTILVLREYYYDYYPNNLPMNIKDIYINNVTYMNMCPKIPYKSNKK